MRDGEPFIADDAQCFTCCHVKKRSAPPLRFKEPQCEFGANARLLRSVTASNCCYWERRHFSSQNGETPKWVVDLLLEKHTSRKTHGNRRKFQRKKLQQQRQTLEIVEDFACEAKFLHFHCSSFFVILSFSKHFFILSFFSCFCFFFFFFHFHFLFFFIFLYFSSCFFIFSFFFFFLQFFHCCYRGRQGAQNCIFRFLDPRKVVSCVCFIVFASSSSIIACVADTQLCRSTTRTSAPCAGVFPVHTEAS